MTISNKSDLSKERRGLSGDGGGQRGDEMAELSLRE